MRLAKTAPPLFLSVAQSIIANSRALAVLDSQSRREITPWTAHRGRPRRRPSSLLRSHAQRREKTYAANISPGTGACALELSNALEATNRFRYLDTIRSPAALSV